MTQRIFDIENEKDMQDLWDILQDHIIKLVKPFMSGYLYPKYVLARSKDGEYELPIAFNWHDKTEITRPVDYEKMIGCVGWFWDDSRADDTPPCLGVLTAIAGGEYYTQVETWGYDNFRPTKKSELKFWGE